MDQKIPIGIMMALNIAFLIIYIFVLIFLLYCIFRKGELRNARILICASMVFAFAATYTLAIILPLRNAVFNIEYFVSLDRDTVSVKDAAGKWVPFTEMIQRYPVSDLLISVVIGIILFQMISILHRKNWIPGMKNVNTTLLIISIALTVIIFRETFQAAVTELASVVKNKIEDTFFGLQAQAGPTNSTSTSNVGYADSLSNLFQWSSLFFALGFGILLYYLLVEIRKSFSSSGVAPNGSAQEAPSNSIRILNTLILLTLAFSLYLVLSVFITIPYLSEMRKPSVYTTAKLDTALKSFVEDKGSDTLQVISGPTMPDSPDVHEIVASSEYIHLKNSPKTFVNSQIQSLKTAWMTMMRARSPVIRSLSENAQNYKSKVQVFRLRLTNNFDAETQSLIVNKAVLYEYTVNRFITYQESLKAYFKRYNEGVNDNDRNNLAVMQEAVNDIKNDVATLSDTTRSPLNHTGYYFTPNATFSEQSIGLVDNDTYLPVTNKDGKDWGLLGVMSGYLIRPQSSEMVLLIGMLGFGLLGASILSFQNNDDESNFIHLFSTKPLIKAFGGVLARGFGAAIIVYLATKGGLAIFSLGNGTQSDPNGYILLLTCFIGAVFSQRVWDKISNVFGSNNPQQTTPPPPPNNNDNPPPDPKKDQQPDKKPQT